MNFDFLEARKVQMVYRALNHKLRKEILQLIFDSQTITVTEIHSTLRIEQSVASQHLAILRKAKLVQTNKKNKFIFYEINHDKFNDLTKAHSLILK